MSNCKEGEIEEYEVCGDCHRKMGEVLGCCLKEGEGELDDCEDCRRKNREIAGCCGAEVSTKVVMEED